MSWISSRISCRHVAFQNLPHDMSHPLSLFKILPLRKKCCTVISHRDCKQSFICLFKIKFAKFYFALMHRAWLWGKNDTISRLSRITHPNNWACKGHPVFFFSSLLLLSLCRFHFHTPVINIIMSKTLIPFILFSPLSNLPEKQDKANMP